MPDRASQEHAVGHQVVTPSQVTCPCSPGQAASAAEQLVVLVSLWQLMVLVPQFAVAVQSAFSRPIRGLFAAKSTRPDCEAQEPGIEEVPRITARASFVRGWLGAWAKLATDTRKHAQAVAIQDFFMSPLL
jgi:hypothetical protein